MGKERIVLEDHRGRTPLGRHVVDLLAANEDVAGGDGLESGDHAQRRGLAAAGRTQEGDELALGHAQVEVYDGGSSAVIDLPDIDEFEIVGHADFRSVVVRLPLMPRKSGPEPVLRR